MAEKVSGSEAKAPAKSKSEKEPTKDELLEEAKELDVPGRSEMSKPELEEAVTGPNPAQLGEFVATPEDRYLPSQLVAEADTLLGVPSFVADVALRRLGGDQEHYTLEQAQKAVAKFNEHEVEA